MTTGIRAVSMLRRCGSTPAAFAVTVLLCAGRAESTAIYAASAIGRLTLVGLAHEAQGTGVFIDGFVLDPGLDVSQKGLASAAASGSANIVDLGTLGVFDVGDAILQDSSSSGEASNGFARSASLTDAFVDVDNASPFDITLLFLFDYMVSVEAHRMNALESAEASASAFMISGSAIFLDTHLFSATELGGGLLTSADSIPFSWTVPAGTADSLALFLDTGGIAVAVPEPPTLGALFLALLALRLRRSRTCARSRPSSARANCLTGDV